MKNKEVKENNTETGKMKSFLESTAAIGKKTYYSVSGAVTNGIEQIVDGSKQAAKSLKAKAANYITRDEYKGYGTNRPDIIKVIDDKVNRDTGDEVIGMIKDLQNVQMLCLYDSAVEFSGLTFKPCVKSDTVYYVHPLNKNCYIMASEMFDEIRKEKMAELQEVARCVGAKRCVVEIREHQMGSDSRSRELSAHGKTTGEDVAKALNVKNELVKDMVKDVEIEAEISTSRGSLNAESYTLTYRIEAEFGGSVFTQKPNLRWYKDDEVIAGIIKARTGIIKNKLKSNTVQLQSSAVRTVNGKKAAALDLAISQSKAGAKGLIETSMEKEQNQIFIYTLEF